MKMDLQVSDLYSDQTWVDLDAVLSAQQKKDLLAEAQAYYESLGVEDIECAIEYISPVSGLKRLYDTYAKPKDSKLNRALAINADFDPYAFKGIISISTFAASTVVSVYKTLSAEGEDNIFVINHSAEARRRTVIGYLRNIEAIDRFFLIDKSIDMLAEFVGAKVKGSIVKSLNAPKD